MKKSLSILLIFICGTIEAQTSTPILDRKISIRISNQTMGFALNTISEKARFTFSYNASLLKVNKIVSIQAENKTVREILDELFNRELTYKQFGNHLVLQKRINAKPNNRIESAQRDERYEMIVSGYLKDAISGSGLSDVSVYHKPSLSNTISGDFGYFKLRIVSKSPDINLQIRKEGYRDTFVNIQYVNGGVMEYDLNLQPLVYDTPLTIAENDDSLSSIESDYIEVVPDSNMAVLVPFDSLTQQQQDSIIEKTIELARKKIEEMMDLALEKIESLDTVRKIKVEDTKLGKWMLGAYHQVINTNIRDSFERKWQVTFVPPIGTNGSLSGLVKNEFSFNTLVGYNGSLNGAEFGGILNFLRGDMQGAQFSGIGNIVGGNSSGAQFAGVFNHNLGYLNAFQGAGFYNYNHFDSRGMQAAGFMNINRGDLDGVQAAGFCNIVNGTTRGVQMAGFMNIARDIDGGQMAGFLNVARKVRGFQIGIINIADSSDGIALGLLNFIKNGIHQLEISSNELDQYGLAYRSGSGKFYSIVSASSQLPLRDTGTLMTYGFGIGYRAKLSKTFYWTTDIGSQHMTFNLTSNHLNLHNRLNTGLEIRLFKGFALFGGVSVSHMINDTLDPRYDTRFSKLVPDVLWSSKGRYAQSLWTGFQFGLRLF